MPVNRSTEGVVQQTELGLMFVYCYGVPVEKEKAAELIAGLSKTLSNEHYDLYRQESKKAFEESFGISESKTKKSPKPSMVYLIECGGRYKIGVSADVDRRLKQLDKRPFALNLIAKSQLFDEAYTAEKKLHQQYQKYNVYGEWFDVPQDELDVLIEQVELSHALDWSETCE